MNTAVRRVAAFLILANTAWAIQPPAPKAPAAVPTAPASQAASGREPGLTLRIFQLDGTIKKIAVLADNQTPNVDQPIKHVDLRSADFSLPAPILTHVVGWVAVTTQGEYRFRLTSDDGARLTIDGTQVIDHDGTHGVTGKESGDVRLSAGDHAMLIEHFDAGGGRSLKLEWRAPGTPDFVVVPEHSLLRELDNARVVAPGVKQLRDARRPGDGVPITGVHPSYSLSTINIEGFKPMVSSMTFVPDGRLIVGTFDPLQRDDTSLPDIESKVPDKLYALSDLTGDASLVTFKACADGLFEPLGLCAVGDDLYVSHRRAITRLTDKDRDGFYETHEDIASGWAAWNYHQFTFGLAHKDGRLYAALSTAMAPPGWEGMGTNAAPNDPLRGSVIEADIASRTFRAIAGGVRTPNGIGFGPGGSLYYADNQGTWMPSNQVGEVVPGRFFGHYNNTKFVPKLAERFPRGGIASLWPERLRAPAALDLVHNDFCNSPTQPTLIERGLFAGQMLIGELTAGGIRRGFIETINGQQQGAAFQFSQGFTSGINRLAWGPGDILMAGGIGAGGNWNWKNTRSGLDRLTPTGVTAFEMLAIRARHNGFEIEFTKPVYTAWLGNTANYTLRQWHYAPDDKYGGPRVGEKALKVVSATPSADGTRVTLEVAGLSAGNTVSIRTDPRSTADEQIWSTTAYYTLNVIPFAPLSRTLPPSIGLAAQPPADGVVLLGRSALTGFSTPGEKAETIAQGRSQAEILAAPEYADVGGGDLVSRASFGDCRLHVEWFSPKGGEGQMAGNSGVYMQDRYEIQVLGTLAMEAGSPPIAANEAGAIYNVKAAGVNASTGPGSWQAYDLFFTAARFDATDPKKKTSDARLTAYWNGILIHENVEIPGPTGSAALKGEQAGSGGVQVGPVRLQAHATAAEGPVRYRNIWIAPLNTAMVSRTEVLPTTNPAGPWRDLLADKTLGAFVIRGGNATYAVDTKAEPPEVVGTSAAGSPNTFLMTTERFGDFELLAEAKLDPALNSGIQIRSSIDPASGDLNTRAGRVRGYQVELDPSARAFSAGIYDEGRRGWLAPLTDNPAARAAFKAGEWNQIQVVARGPVISTWINGVPAAAIFDAMDADGHIALQVHGVPAGTPLLEVRFRKVLVRAIK